MSLSTTLHLVAGFVALGIGLGILAREPGRARHRSFALLCGALALWTLGIVGSRLAPEGQRTIWRSVYLLGSCAVAPLALSFTLILAGTPDDRRRRLTAPAWILVGALWLSLWVPAPGFGERVWPYLAITILGGILAGTVLLLGVNFRGLPAGPERRARQLVFWGALVAVAGGLSDFIPRGTEDYLELGPVAVLVFLLIVCSVIVRHRFLDVDVFLVRAAALVAGGTVAAMIYSAVTRWAGTDFVVLLVTSMAVLAAAGLLGRAILRRAGTWMRPADPLARALLETSRTLARATSTAEIWEIVEEGRARLPGSIRVDVYLRRTGQNRFHLVYRAGSSDRAPEPAPVSPETELARMLGSERLPVTQRFLEQERREARGERAALARAALEQTEELDLKLVAPLIAGGRFLGWAGLGGAVQDSYLTAEVATAMLAVGNQAAAEFERLETLEDLRRKEALATVGEMAAGLAHEVRNPVAAIRGAAQAMGPDASERQREEMLQVIDEETARLGRFVGEFLDYARPHSPRREAVDVARLARRILEAFELSGKHLDAELRVEEGVAVLGDPDQVRRAFENLIQNAWEAAGQGGRLSVEAHRDGERVSIRFEDGGPGIPAASAKRLFRPFHTTRPGGTGLGLALVHRIAEFHGGEIQVEGRPGIGAAFTLCLPVAERGAS